MLCYDKNPSIKFNHINLCFAFVSEIQPFGFGFGSFLDSETLQRVNLRPNLILKSESADCGV